MSDATLTRKIRSPLRICPLGAHVDHQLGQITAMAIDRSIDLHYRPLPGGEVRARSTQFPEPDAFHIADVPAVVSGFWGNFLRGAVLSLRRDHDLTVGIEATVEAGMPTGGLSSSAAVCTAYITALADVNGIRLAPMDVIRYAHWIERDWLGLRNGILDYAANVLCREHALLHLDCRSEAYELVPRPASLPPFSVLLVYSGVSRALLSTGYNDRVDECRAAAWYLQEMAGEEHRPFHQTTLRDVDDGAFAKYIDRLPGRFRRRAQHFRTENWRVAKGVAAWRAGDLEQFGQLMNESGRSSIEHYESGSPELIALYEILQDAPGVYGTRFSGAGFRGYCLALVDPAHEAAITERVREQYLTVYPEHTARFRLDICGTGDGVVRVV